MRLGRDATGAFAEWACVDAALAASKPRTVDFEHAAALPLAGLTSLQVRRDELHVVAVQRVFIPGGAGGVGPYAIQLARCLGAEVTTIASSRGRALVERLGANVVVDYTQTFPELSEHDGAYRLRLRVPRAGPRQGEGRRPDVKKPPRSVE